MVRREKSNYIIQAVSHALDVLEEFKGEVDELGVTELSKKLKLHKNNVFRILATLQSRNYIEQNRANENYRLGVKCLELGQTFIRQRGLLKQAKQVLRELSEATGETSYLSVLRGNDMVYMDAIEASSTIRVVSRVGHRLPVHATAAGKVIVAFESPVEAKKRFGGVLERFTSRTLTDPAQLMKEFDAVRERGYACDLEECEEGLRCIAAPIRDYTRKVVAAVSISGPANRLPDERISGVVAPMVMEAAQLLSTRLGFRE